MWYQKMIQLNWRTINREKTDIEDFMVKEKNIVVSIYHKLSKEHLKVKGVLYQVDKGIYGKDLNFLYYTLYIKTKTFFDLK